MASDVKRPDRKSISKLYVSGHQIRGWFGTDHARNTTALQNVRFRHQSHTVCHTLPGVPVADPLLDPPSIVVVLAGRCCRNAGRPGTAAVRLVVVVMLQCTQLESAVRLQKLQPKPAVSVPAAHACVLAGAV